jgi:hypothetical protein
MHSRVGRGRFVSRVSSPRRRHYSPHDLSADLGVRNLALPHDEHPPSQCLQFSLLASVTNSRGRDFLSPERAAHFRPIRIATRVVVPEAAMNHDRHIVLG